MWVCGMGTTLGRRFDTPIDLDGIGWIMAGNCHRSVMLKERKCILQVWKE